MDTKEKLLEAGKEEFYEKGYEGASLRRICQACGVTTGAFYFSFKSKQELFCSIVDPAAEGLMRLSGELFERELSDPSFGRESDRILMEYEYKHRKELILLLEKSHGSGRETFRESLYQMLCGYFTIFFTKALGRTPKPEIIRLLVQLRMQGNLDLLRGDYDMQQALFLCDVLSCYAETGYDGLLKTLKDVL